MLISTGTFFGNLAEIGASSGPNVAGVPSQLVELEYLIGIPANSEALDMTQIWAPTNMWLWGLEIEFSEGFRYRIKISCGGGHHYISNKISAKYELQRILVSRFPCDAKLSEHFAKKNEACIFCGFGACSFTWPKLELPVVQTLPGYPHRPISHIACRAGIFDWDTSK